MKKMTEAALTAGLVAALLLTGCGEKRATDTNDNRPDVVQQGKQAGEDAAKGAKDLLDDELILLKNAGKRTGDADGGRQPNPGCHHGAGRNPWHHHAAEDGPGKPSGGLWTNPSDIEEYYGEYSSVNTSADHIIGVKVKEGRVDAVRSLWKNARKRWSKTLRNICRISMTRHQAGKIIEKGNYLFLVIAGDSTKGYDREMQRAEQIIDGYFQ